MAVTQLPVDVLCMGASMKKYGRNDLCWCGSGKKYKVCHSSFDDTLRLYQQKGCIIPDKDIIKTKAQIDGIMESGKVNTAVLDYITDHIYIGMNTEEINQLVHKKTIEHGGFPATLGYEGYKKSVCTSINHEVCHGIPDQHTILKDGDIINIDVSTVYQGYYSDASRMFCLGEASNERMKLVEAVKEAVKIGLAQVKPWNCMGDMGQAIHDYAKSLGYSVVSDIGGHGIGLEFHEEPFVSYVSTIGTEMLMVPGMVFTIEPMINMGKPDVYTSNKNGWTVYTSDGKDSAQWEVTVAVTEDGYEVLAY